MIYNRTYIYFICNKSTDHITSPFTDFHMSVVHTVYLVAMLFFVFGRNKITATV